MAGAASYPRPLALRLAIVLAAVAAVCWLAPPPPAAVAAAVVQQQQQQDKMHQASRSNLVTSLNLAPDDSNALPETISSPLAFDRRATPRAPKGYAPAPVDCPRQRPSIRSGATISPQERDWLSRRRNETIPHIRDLLRRLAIPSFDSDAYLAGVESNAQPLPNIALALSGGGYRAMLNGAGALAAWDDRSDGTLSPGKLGGLLQSATYLSALSGGGWLVGSLYANNFTSVQDSLASPAIWQLDESILQGPQQYSLLQYYRNILDQVDDKHDAGFDRSITDYWGRMLSYQLVNASNGGPGYTFSSIAQDVDFAAGRTPLPILVANGRAPGQKIIASNSTVFDFTPWELGSSDPSLDGYAPLAYVGSHFRNGRLSDHERCIAGFDNLGFVLGTSSSLFNQIVLYLRDGTDNRYVPTDVPKFAIDALVTVFDSLGNSSDDIADWTPNPFKDYNKANNPSASSDRLTLVDGGEDLQNIPLHPLLFQPRAVDVVFSLDSSSDTESGWPDGSSLIATYERSLDNISSGTGFPAIPGRDSFLNLGLNTKPVFFGCDAANLSSPAPLVVYLPNYPYVYASNISTFQLSIDLEQRNAIVQNGEAVVTQLNATRDADWPACVACALLSRSFTRTRSPVPDKCRQCFDRYCWDGRLNETKAQPYWPDFVGKPISITKSPSSPPPAPPYPLHLAALAALTVLAFSSS